MNNLEKHKDRIEVLEAEVVGYRFILENIRMIARMGKPVAPGPLFNLCNKAMTEPDGLQIQNEFTFLRLLEANLRHEISLSTKRPSDAAATYAQELKLWTEAMTESPQITKGKTM